MLVCLMDLIAKANQIASEIEDADERFQNLFMCGIAHREAGHRAAANECLECMRSILPELRRQKKLGRVSAVGWVLDLAARLERKDIIQDLVDGELKEASMACATGQCAKFPAETALGFRITGLVHLGAYDEVMEILRALSGHDRAKATESAIMTAASISQWDFAIEALKLQDDPEIIKAWKVRLLLTLHRSEDEELKQRVLEALSQ